MDPIINGVRLSTERPGQRFGFPLIGATSTSEQPLQPRVIGTGTPSPQRTGRVLAQGAVVGNHRITIDFAIEYFAALFNGYTISYFVTGDVNRDGTGLVGLSGDRTEGGIGFGLNITFDLALQIESHPVFQSDRNRTWNEIFNQRVRPNIDLFPLLLTLPPVQALLLIPPEVLQVFSTSSGGSGTVYGLFDRVTNRHLPDGQIQLRPGFSVKVNLASFVPGLSKVLKVLKVIGTSFEMGPNFSLRFPLTIRLVRLTTPDGTYNVGGVPNAFGRFPLTDGPRLNSVPRSITDISTVHTSNVTVSPEFGVYIYVAILKVTMFSRSRSFELFPFLQNGSIIRNFISLSTATTVAQAPEPTGLPKVVWG